MNTIEIIERLKKKLNVDSDYAVAKALGVSRQNVSQWRVGRSAMDAATAMHAAEILEDEPLRLVAAVELERAKSDRQKEVLKRYAGFATPLFLAVILLLSGLQLGAIATSKNLNNLYIMRNRKRRYGKDSNNTNKESLPWIASFLSRAKFAARHRSATRLFSMRTNRISFAPA